MPSRDSLDTPWTKARRLTLHVAGNMLDSTARRLNGDGKTNEVVRNMPSVSQALRQLSRHVEFTDRYLKEHYQNLLVEARHGLTEASKWYQSEEARGVYESYGQLLRDSLEMTVPKIHSLGDKRQVLRWLDGAVRSKRARLFELESTPGFLALSSTAYAEWELCDVLREVLRGKTYISSSYRRWNSPPTNRWYHTPYLADEGALAGKVYWVNHQTRLVLYCDRFQLRWRHGRVLFDTEYRNFAGIRSFCHRRKEFWCFRTSDDREYVLDVSWIDSTELSELKNDLTKHLEGVHGQGDAAVSPCLLPKSDSRSAHT